MTTHRKLKAVAVTVASITSAAAIWWISAYRCNSQTKPSKKSLKNAQTQTPQKALKNAQTQTSDDSKIKRHQIDDVISQLDDDDRICFNVKYTAALYATSYWHVNLNSWTQSSLNLRVPLKEWLKLKKRHTMMLRAFAKLNAPTAAIELYEVHRAYVLNKNK